MAIGLTVACADQEKIEWRLVSAIISSADIGCPGVDCAERDCAVASVVSVVMTGILARPLLSNAHQRHDAGDEVARLRRQAVPDPVIVGVRSALRPPDPGPVPPAAA